MEPKKEINKSEENESPTIRSPSKSIGIQLLRRKTRIINAVSESAVTLEEIRPLLTSKNKEGIPLAMLQPAKIYFDRLKFFQELFNFYRDRDPLEILRDVLVNSNL